MIGGGLEEENDKNWIEERITSPHLKAVADEVRVAMELLGQGKISGKGNALVTVTAQIDDVLTYVFFFFLFLFLFFISILT